MLELIIVLLVVLWLLGYVGPAPFRRGGNFVHVLLLIVVVLVLVRLLQ
jgi:hypothetical protein